MEGIMRLPALLFALPPDEKEITTLGDDAKVHQVPEDLLVVLRVVQGPEPGKGYQITETPLTIGRDQLCSISINDSRMSRQHGAVYYLAPDFYVKDLVSTNGVFVNGNKIKHCQLSNGDRIQLGGTVFEFIISKLAEEK